EPALGGQAVVVDKPLPVTELPGFAEGEVSVQDAAAQRAARLLVGDGLPLHAGAGGRLPPGAHVLDACAAPGGKTAHLLELADLDLLALDSDPVRLARVQDTLNRLQLQARVRAGDARDTAAWWDGRPFDAILLDAPCSASGIVRRHPDVRWLRRPDDITALARLQSEMLEALWPLLKPGGRLLYATCSVFKSEGQGQIDAFLQRHGPTAVRLDPASPGHLLPLPDNASNTATGSGRALQDGFFYALIHKT
ncbi:MAG: 16S rRNA (cytosine(967)-C(5))-methyltransferase RsmB, partial [Rubrivivax sp.]